MVNRVGTVYVVHIGRNIVIITIKRKSPCPNKNGYSGYDAKLHPVITLPVLEF